MALPNLPAYMNPDKTIKQYGADDIGPDAIAQRKWWQTAMQPATTAAAKPSALTSPASTDSTKPTMELLKAVKNPGIAQAGESLLSQFNINKEAGNKGFADYLAEANRLNARARMDLDTDRAALDTTDFARNLESIRTSQADALMKQRDETLKYAAGDRERLLATSGIPSAMNSDMENRAISAYLSASLPVQQQILSQRAADAELLQRMNTANVGVRSNLDRSYLSNLLTPEQARTSLLNSQMGSLGALSQLDNANMAYQTLVQKPYEPNAPALPVYPVSGASYVPPVRSLPPLNYGLLNQQASQAPYYQPQNRASSRPVARRSQAEEDYRRDTGYYPQDDPNFNTMLWESYGGRIGNVPGSQFAEEDAYFNNLP